MAPRTPSEQPMRASQVGRRLRWPVALVTMYSALVWLFNLYVYHLSGEGTHIPFITSVASLGTVLGLLIVFRTNTAYDRWWEGRKLWGQLMNDTRNLAIKVRSFDKIAPTERWDFGRLLVNFARALKEHLREGVRAQQLTMYARVETLLEPKHIPLDVAMRIRERIAGWRRERLIDGYDDLLLDPHVRGLMDVCGGCERIRKTPFVPSYRNFVVSCIVIYLLALPWGLIADLDYWSILATAVVTYFMLGLEFIAEEVAEPFGRSEDDLLLDDICRGLEASVNEVFTEKIPASKSGR